MPLLSDDELPHPSLISEQDAFENGLSKQRTLLRASLNDIAERVKAALTKAGPNLEVFFTVPSSGRSLMTFATPADPNDEDWARVSEIVCGIVGDMVGSEGLRSRELACASSGPPMGAADVVDGAVIPCE